jgi:hypothetical protein
LSDSGRRKTLKTALRGQSTRAKALFNAIGDASLVG